MEPHIDTQALIAFDRSHPADPGNMYSGVKELLLDERLQWAAVLCPNASTVTESMVHTLHAEGFPVRV